LSAVTAAGVVVLPMRLDQLLGRCRSVPWPQRAGVVGAWLVVIGGIGHGPLLRSGPSGAANTSGGQPSVTVSALYKTKRLEVGGHVRISLEHNVWMPARGARLSVIGTRRRGARHISPVPALSNSWSSPDNFGAQASPASQQGMAEGPLLTANRPRRLARRTSSLVNGPEQERL